MNNRLQHYLHSRQRATNALHNGVSQVLPSIQPHSTLYLMRRVGTMILSHVFYLIQAQQNFLKSCHMCSIALRVNKNMILYPCSYAPPLRRHGQIRHYYIPYEHFLILYCKQQTLIIRDNQLGCGCVFSRRKQRGGSLQRNK